VEILLIIIYGFFLTFILFYSLIQMHLVILYLKRRKIKKGSTIPTPDYFPFVTIQLPIYNELYVVERLILQVSKIDYPKDRFEVQILDDSNDETTQIIRKVILKLKESKVKFDLVRRPNRIGFKAGALAYGMNICQGEFIAIFDADFLPKKDFLKKTIPYFIDKKVGVVQTKWAHINENYSKLTQIQAFGLDAHFTIEQGGRNYGKYFINFNGTAGVWRKTCIEDAGGWSADTLTEDLDLSYRAQLKGWYFKYLEKVESPAELPAAMNALKNQQFRWTKGAAECTRKNLIRVLKTKNLPISTKLHSVFHLMNSFIFICVFSVAILSIPIFYVKLHFVKYALLFKYATGFISSMFFLLIFYWVAQRSLKNNLLTTLKQFIWKFPLFLAVSMGMSLHNGIAVMEGYLGKKSPFVRTPKFNLEKLSDKWYGNKYLASSIGGVTILEGVLFIYFLGGIALSFYYNSFGLLPLFLILSFGFGYVFFYSIFHSSK
jgi:cellulose synthase/poly-beta-1,6-N-acetylglucosamine synthase-like glycosyltransferase